LAVHSVSNVEFSLQLFDSVRTTVSSDTWTRVAVTIESGVISLYVDGNLIGSENIKSSILSQLAAVDSLTLRREVIQFILKI